MTRPGLRVILAQLNFLVGDVDGNVSQMVAAAGHARERFGGDLVVFPELAFVGYPPEDLLLRPELAAAVTAGLTRMQKEIRGIDVLVGHPLTVDGLLYNVASWLRDGQTIACYRKRILPNYGVFDEKRYFSPGDRACVVEMHGIAVGVTICEDVWTGEPVESARRAGATVIMNLNASPYHRGKEREREEVLRARVRETGCAILYANLVGGQDELVFDGASFALNAHGVIGVRAPAFRTGLFPVDLDAKGEVVPGALAPVLGEEEGVYEALVLGVRDYVRKNGFQGVVLGLSGGIDSALTLALAVDALGPLQVRAVMMPSPYTSGVSLEAALRQARRLGVAYSLIPIGDLFEGFLAALAEEFRGTPRGIAEENLQARIRGALLMAISNKTGRLVLTTGNKSEMAVGYATLYGDMAGGFAVIKDVPKMLVYQLADYVNRCAQGRGEAAVISAEVISRPPTAELAPDQKDSDSLPPYPLLDAIVEAHVERSLSIEQMVAEGFDAAAVERVVGLIRRNEYKRHQAPPGIRITGRAFGRDWRYPITGKYPS